MIIGLTGSYGAGKGAAVKYLINERRFKHFSARKFITKEVESRGLEVNRDSMIDVANDLRATHGATYIVETLFRGAENCGEDAIVESLRAVVEVQYVKEHGGVVIGIDADPQIRYTRAVNRHSETDHVSFEKWQKQQEREVNPDDPTKQDIFSALNESDHIVLNNGTLEELHIGLEGVLLKIA